MTVLDLIKCLKTGQITKIGPPCAPISDIVTICYNYPDEMKSMRMTARMNGGYPPTREMGTNDVFNYLHLMLVRLPTLGRFLFKLTELSTTYTLINLWLIF